METIEFEVVCMGCGNFISTPSDADVDLFRLGIRIHDNDDCFLRAESKISGHVFVGYVDPSGKGEGNYVSR